MAGGEGGRQVKRAWQMKALPSVKFQCQLQSDREGSTSRGSCRGGGGRLLAVELRFSFYAM